MRIPPPPSGPNPWPPQALLLLGSTLGIFLALLAPLPPPGAHPAWLALLATGLGLGAYPYLGRHPLLKPTAGLLAGLLLAFAATAPRRPRPPRPLATDPRVSRPLPATGQLSEIRPLGRSRLARLQLQTLGSAPERRALSVILPASAPPVREGDRVAVHLVFGPWPVPLNPGGRDQTQILRKQGLAGRARILDLVRLAGGATGPFGRRYARFREALLRARERVRRALVLAIPEPDLRGTLTALSLGDGSAVPRPTRQAFARAGLAHLLAISGLHLGLLVLGAFAVLRRGLALPAGLAAGCCLTLTGFLVTWMDHPASGMRAGLMVIPFFLAVALRRRPHPARALHAAVLGLLLIDPTLLSRVGFQLSCAAAAGLVLAAGPALGASRETSAPPGLPEGLVLRLLRRALRSLGSLSEATFWATVATAPLVLHHFGRLPAAGLLTNLLAIPLTGLLLMALTPAVAAAALFGPAAIPLFVPARHLSHLLVVVAEEAARWPAASVVLEPRATWQVGAFCLLLLPALLLRLTRWKRRGLALLALLCLLWPNDQSHPPRAALEVTFLSVGHGDSVLVRTAAGDLLIDGGGDHQGARAVGARLVVPALRALGVKRLAAVILTHPHPDHLGGLPAVLEAFPVESLHLSGEGLEEAANGSGPLAQLYALALARDIPIRLACGDPLPTLEPVRLTCLWPLGSDPEGPWDPLASANDNSVVLHLALGEISFLLPGDLEAPGEAALIQSAPPQLRATVLKAPHHGSSTSSTPEFVAQVAPQHVVYSVGRRGRFAFPRPSVVARWRAAGARGWRTDRHGAITFRTEGRSLQVQPFLRNAGGQSAAGGGSPAPPGGSRPSPPRSSVPGAPAGRD